MAQLDLRKEIILDLKKEKGIANQIAEIAWVSDHSGSMDKLYQNGEVQDLAERVLPLALAFDNDGSADVFRFDSVCKKMEEPITVQNLNGYVNKFIYNRNQMGSTKYAPAINAVVDFYVGRYVPKNVTPPVQEEKKGFFGKLFGGKDKPVETVNNQLILPQHVKLLYPVYVMFVTDGNNDHDDIYAAKQALIRAAQYGIFFQFIGIGNERFSFLEELDNMPGRLIDNANFFNSRDIKNEPDTMLYSKLMTEFPSWLKEAKAKGLIA